MRKFTSIAFLMGELAALIVICLLAACGKTEGSSVHKSSTETTRTIVNPYAPYFAEVCAYQYEPGQGNTFAQWIDDFLMNDPDGKTIRSRTDRDGPQKYALLQKYKTLWQTHYESDIARTRLQIFKSKPLAESNVLSVSLPPSSAKKIAFELTNLPYKYANNEAFVDFANKIIGGGAITLGFVQEEIEMLLSTYLPWLTETPRSDQAKTSVAFCKSVNLKELDTKPVLMRFHLPFHLNNEASIYGKKLRAVKPPEAAANYLVKGRDNPYIYSVALAAKNFVHTGAVLPYDVANMTVMTVAAVRGFLDAMLAMHADSIPIVIHTGNWGAGVFGGNIHTVFTMQAIAAMAAYELFSALIGEKKTVRFIYDAYDDASKLKAEVAAQRLKSINQQKTLLEHIQLLSSHIESLPQTGPTSWSTGA